MPLLWVLHDILGLTGTKFEPPSEVMVYARQQAAVCAPRSVCDSRRGAFPGFISGFRRLRVAAQMASINRTDILFVIESNRRFRAGDLARAKRSIEFGVERDFSVQELRDGAILLGFVRHAREVLLAKIGHAGAKLEGANRARCRSRRLARPRGTWLPHQSLRRRGWSMPQSHAFTAWAMRRRQ
jgi:hypothetical protein